MKNNLLKLLVLSACSLSLASCGSVKSADTVIYGNIYTANSKNHVVEALAIKDGKILFAGNEKGVEKYINNETKIERYAKDKLVSPALVDAHNHLVQLFVAQAHSLGTIPNGASKAECVSAIDKYVKDNPNMDFYILTGWEMQNFSTEEYGCPTASMIDHITQKPILASSSDGHTYWVNTPLMTLAGVTKETQSPVGGEVVKDKNGNPLGIFKDNAQSYIENVKPGYPQEAYDIGIENSEDTWIKQGYVFKFDALGNNKAFPTRYPAITQLEQKDKLGQLKTYTQSSFVIMDTDDGLDLVDTAISLRDETKGGMHEMTNVKFFLDGIIENAGAYLSKPYEAAGVGKADYYGTPIWPGKDAIERMSKIIAKANKAGLPCHFHCMGDQSTTDALDAIEMAAKQIGKSKVKQIRNAITHLALVNENDYARFKDLGVVAVLNPWMNKDPGYFNALQIPLLGKDRAEAQYPAKSFVNNGVKISFGTDMGASFTFNSVECFHALTTRMYNDDDPTTLLKPSEKLTRYEALNAMTMGGAYQLHRENVFGSLEAGKDASLCIFSKDLLNINDSEIMSTVVEKTMISGEWYSK